MNLEGAKREIERLTVKGIKHIGAGDPLDARMEKLPGDKQWPGVVKRLEMLKSSIEVFSEDLERTDQRIIDKRTALIEERKALKTDRAATVEVWAMKFVGGEEAILQFELERVASRLAINSALRGLRVAESILKQRRQKKTECLRILNDVERAITVHAEAEKIVREARDELAAITPFDSHAPEQIAVLWKVLQKYESSRRSGDPDGLMQRLDEVEEALGR